mgnify:CR=1 FL=1
MFKCLQLICSDVKNVTDFNKGLYQIISETAGSNYLSGYETSKVGYETSIYKRLGYETSHNPFSYP